MAHEHDPAVVFRKIDEYPALREELP